MAWKTTTNTVQLAGNSSMGPNTALSRQFFALGSGLTLTAFELIFSISPGASGTTYNTLPTNTPSAFPTWFIGISYVVTGGTVPNLLTNNDDPQFLWEGTFDPWFDRNTINQAGSPAYADNRMWSGIKRGRIQLPTGVGGTVNWHVANTSTTATIDTFWNSSLRVSSAAIV